MSRTSGFSFPGKRINSSARIHLRSRIWLRCRRATLRWARGARGQTNSRIHAMAIMFLAVSSERWVYPLGAGAFLSIATTRKAPPVAVMSYHAWEEKYGSDPSVVSSIYQINGHPFTIIGVTPLGVESGSFATSTLDCIGSAYQTYLAL